MKVSKKLWALSLSLVLLTGCGDNSKVNSLISEQGAASGTAGEASNADEYYATMTVDESNGVVTATMPDTSNGEIDVDLTQLDSTMIYAQVCDMMNNSSDYLGKTIKVKGPFSYIKEDDGREFFAVLISDATACCSQGIEFVLTGDHKYPADYPAVDTEITVTGKFNTYTEEDMVYCQLTNATMEKDGSLSW